MTFVETGVADWAASPEQRYAHELLEYTNTYLSRMNNDVERGVALKKIDASTRDSLGYRFLRFYGDWLSYYGSVGETGINFSNSGGIIDKSHSYLSTAKTTYDPPIGTAMGPDASPKPSGEPIQPPDIFPSISTDSVGWGLFALGIVGIVTWRVIKLSCRGNHTHKLLP